MYIRTISTVNCSLSAGSVAAVYRRGEGEASRESTWTVGDAQDRAGLGVRGGKITKLAENLTWTVGDAQDRAGLGVRGGKITWHYTDVEYLLDILIKVHE